MITSIELFNYLSFNHVKFDLLGKRNTAKNFSLVYGENGSGKSNLISSILFLLKTFQTLPNQENAKRLLDHINTSTREIKDENARQKLTDQLLRESAFSLSDLISENKSIGSINNMKLVFGFILDNIPGEYSMEFNGDEIIDEYLKYAINERSGYFFKISAHETTPNLSPSIFLNNSYRSELRDNIKKYWGKNTFLSILYNEISTKNDDYIDENINNKMLEIMNWMRGICVLCKAGYGMKGSVGIPYEVIQELESGLVNDINDPELLKCQSALNKFFTNLYSDVKNVFYKFESSGDSIRYNLNFEKIVADKLIQIPIQKESTGTRKLLDIFPFIINSALGATVFIDEVDSGIHDLLMEQIIDLLKDSMKGQFIATTHNTLLMDHASKDSVYIIHSDIKGNKEITCVSDYSSRTQKNNSIRSKYLKGDYEGLPYIGYLDLEDLAEELLDDDDNSYNGSENSLDELNDTINQTQDNSNSLLNNKEV